MRLILKIIYIAVAMAAVNGCTSAEKGAEGATHVSAQALLQVELETGFAVEHDHIHNVRYIVFDNASTRPRLDVNESVAVTDGNKEATKFKATLKVSANTDKMIIAVVNEPAAVSARLDNITSPGGFEDIVFGMADVFDANHLNPGSTGLPMAGVKRDIAVVQDDVAAVQMAVERAVARVEIWLSKDDDVDHASVTSSTAVVMSRSHTEGYLITGTETDRTRFQTGGLQQNNFGHMLTVSDPVYRVNWIYTGLADLQLTDTPQLVCAFYTPERTCSVAGNADKLTLDIYDVETSSGARTSLDNCLDVFTPDGGGKQAIVHLRRNNVYQVFARVKSNALSFESKIVPWKEAGQGVIIDPQYYIRVNRDDLYLGGAGDKAILTVSTNYDRDDRGFPRGIWYSRITVEYYDSGGNLLDSSSGDLYGWLDIGLDGSDGDLSREIGFAAAKPLIEPARGYYAIVRIAVANITKTVRVSRY